MNKVWLKNNSNLRNSPNDNNETGEKIEESSSKSVITCDCFADSAVINYTGFNRIYKFTKYCCRLLRNVADEILF